LAAAADRCLIPEHPFNFERLTSCSPKTGMKPERYSIVMSRKAQSRSGDMVFCDQETDMYGHKMLGGIGDLVARRSRSCRPS
jgi:6-phosphofructokinase 1